MTLLIIRKIISPYIRRVEGSSIKKGGVMLRLESRTDFGVSIEGNIAACTAALLLGYFKLAYS